MHPLAHFSKLLSKQVFTCLNKSILREDASCYDAEISFALLVNDSLCLFKRYKWNMNTASSSNTVIKAISTLFLTLLFVNSLWTVKGFFHAGHVPLVTWTDSLPGTLSGIPGHSVATQLQRRILYYSDILLTWCLCFISYSCTPLCLEKPCAVVEV